MTSEAPPPDKHATANARWKWLAAVALLLVFGAVGFALRDTISLAGLAKYETQLRDFTDRRPAVAYAMAFGVYVLVAALSLPGATAMTLVIGWLFGRGHLLGWPAVILVSFASTTGATLAFILARYLLRDVLQRRFQDRLAWFNEALDREGPYFLFTLRLIPLVPFFVINAVMGLTRMRVLTFWWISQLGMLPATFVYVWAGAQVPTLAELAERGVSSILSWRLILALALLGIFPIAVRWTMRAISRSRATAGP